MPHNRARLTSGARVIEIVAAHSTQELDALREIMREYGAGLGIDLNFQDFAAELRQLPGAYCSPRGALLSGNSPTNTVIDVSQRMRLIC